MRRRRALAALAVSAAVVLGAPEGPPQLPAAPAVRPNVVFILTDDLSWNLLDEAYAPHIAALRRRGLTFTRYFVSDSLCCPSRASIFTGLFPHNSGIYTNRAPDGGYVKFRDSGLERRTFATALQKAGYRTSLLGKYMNEYGEPQMTPTTAPVPPGWTDWHVSDLSGYFEFNYRLNDNGTVNSYGGPGGDCTAPAEPSNYEVDVLGRKAIEFLDAAGSRPFAVEIATFSPHAPFTPAERDSCAFPGLTHPRDPSFNAPNSRAPKWLAARGPLTPQQVRRLDRNFRKRAQSVLAIDKLVADLQAALRARGLLDNTYIVFSSDNGFHMGQHRLDMGKQTAFDSDIRVPLIVAGPGVPRGKTSRAVAQNVDLHPTFLELAGKRPDPEADGRSLVPLLHPARGRAPWRSVALVEHRHQAGTGDPDADVRQALDPPHYRAIRLSGARLPEFRRPLEAVYVEYTTKEIEYYDIRRDPDQRHNIAARLTSAQLSALHRILVRLTRCEGADECRKAGSP